MEYIPNSYSKFTSAMLALWAVQSRFLFKSFSDFAILLSKGASTKNYHKTNSFGGHQADSKHFLPIILHQPPLVFLKRTWLKHLLFLFLRLRKCGRSILVTTTNEETDACSRPLCTYTQILAYIKKD